MTKFYELLQNKKISQRQLGKLLGMTTQLVNYWCSGKSIPRLPEVVKIAKILNVSIEEVVLCFTEGDKDG